MLISQAQRTIERYGMLAPGDRVVVAVSGGPDSICLLSVLNTLAKDLGLVLHIAHLDHGFRGAESAAEARFVEHAAAELGIPATVTHRDVPAYCASRGLAAPAGAREVRYAFLEEVAAAVCAQRIALGHTADDQAETVIMRLLRGAGPGGLSGIPPTRGRIIRPLLEVTREEILAYLGQRSIAYVTDPSNDRPSSTRNRIRLELMPVLRRFNPSLTRTLAAEAGVLRDEDAALEARLAEALPAVAAKDGSGVRLDRDRFLALPPALMRRLLRGVILDLTEGAAELSSVQTADALQFLQAAGTGRRMEPAAGLVLEREYGAFVVRHAEQPPVFDVPMPVPGSAQVPLVALEATATVADAPFPDGDGTNYLWQAVFDYDKITLPLRLRSRLPGDSFRPAGMHGKRKKLQDLFTDEKVPRRSRDRVPLLCAGQDILWVIGMRTDERFLAGPGTKNVLVVTVRKHPLTPYDSSEVFQW